MSGSAPGGPGGVVEGALPGAGPAGLREAGDEGQSREEPGNAGTRMTGDQGPAG
jgi:hypothetical protein